MSEVLEALTSNCDGKEQYAFEAWAKSQHYDMHEHPLHYLFLDPKTGAAREGWNACIRYCRETAEAVVSAQAAEIERLKAVALGSAMAINFYDKVQAASKDEQIAVGTDHWDWLLDAARKARAALQPATTDNQLEDRE